MAAGVAEVFQSRLPGSDGSYTDQVVVKVDADAPLGWYRLGHDLNRVPDWVRITKLTYGIALESPATAPGAHLEPCLNVAESLAAGRLRWDAGLTGNPDGRPPTMTAGHDLTTDLWFGAAGDPTIPPNGGPGWVGQDAYYLVEFGITHSAVK